MWNIRKIFLRSLDIWHPTSAYKSSTRGWGDGDPRLVDEWHKIQSNFSSPQDSRRLRCADGACCFLVLHTIIPRTGGSCRYRSTLFKFERNCLIFCRSWSWGMGKCMRVERWDGIQNPEIHIVQLTTVKSVLQICETTNNDWLRDFHFKLCFFLWNVERRTSRTCWMLCYDQNEIKPRRTFLSSTFSI